MENFLSDAFVTGLTVTGRYVTSAFQSDPEELRKDEKLNGGKIDDDIASIQGKICRHFRTIDMGCYMTEKALENLALEKESIQIDLMEMRQRMCVDHSGKSNYLRMLIQLLGKLNSLAKEIKKINKFRSANLNKRLVLTSEDARRRSQSPTKLPLQKTNNLQGEEKKKSPIEGIMTKYEQALKSELEYRQTSATFSNVHEKIKQNVRQFNLKKVKKMRVLNKKVDEVYQQQKEKQTHLYDQLMKKKAGVMQDTEHRSILTSNNNIHNVSRNHQDFRQTVQNKKQLLEQELHEKLNKLMVKHQTKCLLLTSSTQNKASNQINRRIKEAQERKQILEQHAFESKLQKVVEKEEKIRDIVPNHQWRNSTKTDLAAEEEEEVVKPIMKMSYTMKELPTRNSLLQTLTESQSRVSYRKDMILKQMSDDIRLKLEDRFQRQMKRHQENILNYNGRMQEIQNRMAESKRKTRAYNIKGQRQKENAIKDKFKIAVDRYNCDEKISQLKSLTIQDLEKRAKMGKQAAIRDLNL